MKKITLTLLLLFCVRVAFAITPFVITDIRVEGLERLEAGTVFNYLPLKVGDELNDEEARLSIKELFSTGFFKDVALEQDGTVLVVKVAERPSISTLTIEGNKALESEALNQGLEQSGLVQGRIFNEASLDRVKQEIKNTYLSMGRYSATVESEVEELDRNRVAITLNINEGRVAKIKKVNIIGASAISANKLEDEMQLRDTRGFSPFSKRNQYSKQKLEADIETIRSYYLDRGFHDFKIVSSNVDISPNKQNIFISISIEEGNRYVFGDTVFEGTEDTNVTGLEDLISIEAGEPFSRKVVNASRTAITNKFADEGYAFVDVRPIHETDTLARLVDTVFVIDPRQRVYVRKINISGNAYTRDEVIRRELRQFEGSWYSAGSVNLSRTRLRRLGYFEEVTIETPSVPGTSDQVDMNVVVKERNTGSISFSLGYSNADGALIGASYGQRNLFGTGKELNVDLNTSDAARTASVSFVDPYSTENGVGRTISFTDRRVDTRDVNTAEYIVNTTAGGLSYKIPISEVNSLNLGFTLERIELKETDETPPEIRAAIAAKPEGDDIITNLGISKDTRDDFFFPTRGATGLASLEVAVPGSEYEYYKINLQGSYYFPLSEFLTTKTGLGIGYGDGFGDFSEFGLPFFRNYFAGGSNSVRGYDGRSLGPRDSGLTPSPLGGNKRLLVNAELLLPPFGEGASKDKRVGWFVDGGMVYGTDESIDVGTLRYSTGVVFNWFSPVGPFSLSYAFPINDEPGDDLEEFQISFGTVLR